MMSGSKPDRGELGRLLQEAGSAYDAQGVETLIEGVLAAPAEVGMSWHALVADPMPPALAEELEMLRAATAKGYHDGLSAADFEQLPCAARLGRLRQELAAQGLDGFIVPRADEHQGEYVPSRGQRLAWLTGFTGSAGTAIALRDRAALFVDGRYTLQAVAQVDTQLFEIHHLVDEPPAHWIGTALARGAVLGYDPWLHTPLDVERFRAAAEKAGAVLRAVSVNPVDRVWSGRPAAPIAPVVPHPERFVGESAQSKRARIGGALAEEGAGAAVVLTMPESIAWLLNIRGGDVPHTPLPLSFAILRQDGSVTLFIDRRKLVPGLERHLGNAVTVMPPEEVGPALDALAAEGGRIQVDAATAASWIFDRLEAAHGKIHRAADPCLLPKACKNPIELDGTRSAHRRDGVALTRFLAWLAREAPKGGLAEIAASDRLEAIRREGEHFRDLSFPTISGAGSNGAIVHYGATPETEKRLEPGSLYLLDSGAQYLDGTTDVTRTVAIGDPTPEMRERFTRVLKGHIALALARFPKGTTGTQLEGPQRPGAAARNDRLERTRLLQDRGLRHPHREPRPGAAYGGHGRARDAGLRDPDPGADRPQPDRTFVAGRRRDRLARRLSHTRSRYSDPARRPRDGALARRSDAADRKRVRGRPTRLRQPAATARPLPSFARRRTSAATRLYRCLRGSGH